MRRTIPTLVVFVAGGVFTLALLTRCSVPNANAGGESTDKSAFRSGSRLKMRTLVSGDGASQFLGWYDAQLQAECSPETVVTGDIRCLPKHQVLDLTASRYSDANCQQLILRGAAAEEVADLLLVTLEGDIKRVGNCIPAGDPAGRPTTYARDGKGGCYDTGRRAEGYCEAGDVVPREMFARLAPATVD
jgi:hypothetical protein